MPVFEITAPDGTVYEVTAPEGAPEQQALDRVKAQYQQQPQPQQPQSADRPNRASFAKELATAAAATARDYGQGALGLAALPVDAIYGVWNKFTGRNDPNASQSIDYYLNKAGIPQTENPYIRGINRAMGGIATGLGTGNALRNSANQITSNVGNALQTARSQQVAGGISGSTAAQLTADAGGGPVAQTAASLVGGVTGGGGLRTTAAEGAKRSFRGGEAGRQTVADNIQLFDDVAGATPSAGQATQNRRMMAAESGASRAPGSAGVMAKRSEALAESIGTGVDKIAGKLAGKTSAEQAGRAINQGAEGFVRYLRNADDALYGKVDKLIPADTAVSIPKTQQYLAQTTSPIKGAPNTSKMLANPRFAQIAEAIGADVQAAANGQLPYQAVRQLRTRVGEALQNNALVSDVPTKQLRRLYAMLSDDLQGAAKLAGPDAERAATRANNFHRAGMRRLEMLETVVNKNGGPEKVFAAATNGTKEGATRLRAVMQSLPEDGQKMLTATVLRRLGRAKGSFQDDLGEKFSTETFLTNWNGLSAEAKTALFDRHGTAFRNDMDKIAKVASNLRDGSAVFRNPSGTAQATAQMTAAASFAGALFSGRIDIATGIAAGVAGTNLSARLLTHPPFVRWLATQTQRPAGAVPAALNQLAQSKDPLLQEAAAAFLADQQQGNVAQQ